MNIGENVRLRRLAKRMSQEQLAEKANISATMISYIEKGLKPLSLKTGYLIAKALDCKIDDLIETECQFVAQKIEQQCPSGATQNIVG